MNAHETETHTVCPACGGEFWFPNEGLGMSAPCPHCGLIMDLTAPSSPKVDEPKPPTPKTPSKVIVTSGNDVNGYSVESYLGIVHGIAVRGSTATQDFFAEFKRNWGGGNIDSYTKLANKVREDAFAQ